MKIAMGIVVVTLALAVAADAAPQVPEKYRNKENSMTWSDIGAIKEMNEKQTNETTKDGRESGRATTTLEYHDKLVRQQARENKINALDRRCEGNNSALCRKHNDR